MKFSNLCGFGCNLMLFCLLTFIVFVPMKFQNDDAFQPHSPFKEMKFQSNLGTEENIESDTEKDEQTKKPILIWWTNGLFPHPPGEQLVSIDCEGYQCLSTNHRQYLADERTRGIIFYGSDITPDKLPLPRKSTHEWALFHEESPMNNYVLSKQTFISLFNHTATFSRESDYQVTTQNIYSLKFLTKRKPVSLDVRNAEKAKRNLAPVFYAQSHAGVPSDRDSYVEELMKYIKVDSYGTCLHNKDLPEHLTDPAENFENFEFLDFISVYKFHLAFENAVCKDYMTEKLMRPLHVGSIPIYYGSPYAQDWMPNNSTVIMVNDFGGPKELAEFITYLDNNDEEYEKYMQFKKPGGVTNQKLLDHMEKRPWGSHDHNFHIFNEDNRPDYFQGFECHVCKNIHKRIENEKQREFDTSVPPLPPKMANDLHMGCPEPFSSLGLTVEELKDRWTDTDWVQVYRTQEMMASAVYDMIAANETNSEHFINYLNKYLKNKNVSL
ncbi:alpha-(1,3)-fucosyltransferase 11-like [Mizuhopecten yessoensis]|uniref:Fucosyltransferase n=1 Tax=Mizuhopecten yessoensis TaxID=6573 RepID=A0A210QAA1_MIZYE|nr:alpha-(1,3)-fucosyltransferase 11-like [Mizuhopecten yessoensis]OWF45635.1 Alpha-(1,3)-fucosyltransferase 11 [Mizuhopecten yessoensis]